MKEFFKVTHLDDVLDYISLFNPTLVENVAVDRCLGRVLAADVISEIHLPDFPRTTVDGYAVRASSTFGASEGRNTVSAFDFTRGVIYSIAARLGRPRRGRC